MRKSCTLLFVVFGTILMSSPVFGQQRRSKKTNMPITRTQPHTPTPDPALAVLLPNPLAQRSAANYETPRDFEDYLVQLALTNNPELEAVGYQLEIDRQEILLAKKEWNKNLTVGINVNESNLPYFMVNTLNIRTIGGREIDLERIPQTVNYPFWNLGFNFNVGDILNRKHKVAVAETRQKITQTEGKRRKTEVRALVLGRYQKYLTAVEILKVRLQLVDAAEANKTSVANLYAVNKARIEEYNEANKNYFMALEEKVKAEADIRFAKYELEEVIGAKWETVERMKAAYDESNKIKEEFKKN